VEEEPYQLLADLHRRSERQGPGGEAETRRALELASLDPSAALEIADIGCGTGASALLLARELNAHVTALDLLPEFTGQLQGRADEAGLSDAIDALVGSMDALPFASEQFDVIWSEGAVYNIGFRRGVNDWRRFLKPGGVLVVSEITWTTGARPPVLQAFWEAAYPEVATASAKLAVLEESGYTPAAYFTLPQHCWLDNYYLPLQRSFNAFLERHGNSELAREIVAQEQEEIALYRRFGQYYSYGVYIARRVDT
jgi:ubiquinone/menaquinone biosynthesis C-methylase UbiE